MVIGKMEFEKKIDQMVVDIMVAVLVDKLGVCELLFAKQ